MDVVKEVLVEHELMEKGNKATMEPCGKNYLDRSNRVNVLDANHSTELNNWDKSCSAEVNDLNWTGP